MAATAFQEQFRQETIAAFELGRSLVRDTTTTEIVVKGNQATFLVAGSGGASAVTRGVDGMIPARADDLTQTTVTLTEWHDLVRKTRFNIFASQGDQRAVMQRTTVGVINRKVDADIITELNTGTVNTGTAATATLGLVTRAKAILGNNKVPFDGNIFALITPAFESYLYQIKEFGNAEYVDIKPIPDADLAFADRPKAINWLGVKWIVHPELPGAATSAEKCFMYHASAIGHAMDMTSFNTAVGYEEENDYSFARATCFMGTQILQNSGVVVMNHDGSAMAAA